MIVIGDFHPVIVLRAEREAGTEGPRRVQDVALPDTLVFAFAIEGRRAVGQQEAVFIELAGALVPLRACVEIPAGETSVTRLDLLGELVP